MRVIYPVVDVLVNDCAYPLRLEEAAPERLLGQQSFAQEWLHRSAEPIADRDAKAHLFAREILTGNKLFQHFLEQVLSRHAAQLHLFGQGSNLHFGQEYPCKGYRLNQFFKAAILYFRSPIHFLFYELLATENRT